MRIEQESLDVSHRREYAQGCSRNGPRSVGLSPKGKEWMREPKLRYQSETGAVFPSLTQGACEYIHASVHTYSARLRESDHEYLLILTMNYPSATPTRKGYDAIHTRHWPANWKTEPEPEGGYQTQAG